MQSLSSPSTTTITLVRDHPALLDQAAAWFHGKWSVPLEAYRESMADCIAQPESVPQWYVVLDESGTIIAGCGIIENDFHARKDLAPNLCALYVEESYRGRGLAQKLTTFAHRDITALGRPNLYLITDHMGLYERWGWKFLELVADDDTGDPVRLYQAPASRLESHPFSCISPER